MIGKFLHTTQGLTDEQKKEAADLPLHAKQVPLLSLQKLTDLMPQHLKEAWEQHLRFFLPGSKVQEFQGHAVESDIQLTLKDLRVLLTNQLVEPAKQVLGTIRTFTLPEFPKHRRRWITHPKRINKIIASSVGIPFSKAALLRRRKARYAWCFDYAAYFHQFPLHQELRPYYCFRGPDGEFYQLTTIPTGGRESPLLAQIASTALAYLAAENLEVEFDVVIDNVRFTSENMDHLRKAGQRFTELSAAVGATLNQDDGIQQIYDFVGIHFNHLSQTVQLSQRFVDKLQQVDLSELHSYTLRQILGLFGKLAWAAQILDIDRSPFYTIFKFLRRRVGQQLDASACTWPCNEESWRRWLSVAISNVPVPIVNPSPSDDVLYTDACEEGWGAMLFAADGSTSVVAASWPRYIRRRYSINHMELQAIWQALDAMQGITRVQIVIDNTSAEGAMANTRSPAFLMNVILKRIYAIRVAKGITVTRVSHIDTANNCADYWSRLGYAFFKTYPTPGEVQREHPNFRAPHFRPLR